MFNLNSTSSAKNNSSGKTENENIKKKRDEYLVDIRCQERGKILNTKRVRNMDQGRKIVEVNLANADIEPRPEENNTLKSYIDIWLKKSYDMKDFYELVQAINTEDRFKQHYGVIGIRKILSKDDGPPIQLAIEANLIPRLIQFTQHENDPHLQLEACWALTNIASGTSQQTQCVVEKGGIPNFIRLLNSSRIEIIEQAVWAIGNIAGNGAKSRDIILAYGGLQPLVDIVSYAKDMQIDGLVKHGTWTLSNLCRGRPLPEFDLIKGAMPILSRIIQEEYHYEVLSDASWAISNFSDGKEDRIEMIIQTGIIPSLVRHLDNPCVHILLPIIRTLGNILSGNENQTNMVLQVPKVVKKLLKLLYHEKKVIKREICWALSNIAAGDSTHVELIIEESIYVKLLIELALSDYAEVRREASCVIQNLLINSTQEQLAKLLKAGIFEYFCALLDNEDAQTVNIGLGGIEKILKYGSLLAQQEGTENQFSILLATNGGVKLVERLQTHPCPEVYEKALNILENHFEVENSL